MQSLRVTIDEVSLPADRIRVTLTPYEAFGTLTVRLRSPAIKDLVYAAPYGGGTYTFNFSPLASFSEGQEFAEVYVEWRASTSTSSPTTATAAVPYRFKILGYYLHTQYNSPVDTLCGGPANAPWCYQVWGMVVDKAWIGYDGNLVLTGTTSTRAPHVLIGKADSPTNEWIRSWNYAFSPSGRYLAYQAFTPRTGGPPTPWSVVLIYDLEKSREENLPPGTSAIPDWPRDCTGRPVFPETNVFRDNCERGNQPDLEFNVHSSFLWSPDERRVYFLARENQDLLLVRVNLPWTRGAPLPVWRQKLDMEHFHVTEAGYVYDSKRVSRIWADQLSWTTAGRIRVDLDPDYGFGSSFEIEAD